MAWKEGHDAFLPSRMGGGGEGWVDRGKRETLIEPIKCRRRSFFLLLGNRWLNRLFYGKHSWNLESNFPIAGRAAFEFEFFPLWKGRISLFLHPSILIIRVVYLGKLIFILHFNDFRSGTKLETVYSCLKYIFLGSVGIDTFSKGTDFRTKL